jgi:elongation factor Ts
MAAITAGLVAQLRERTGLGMMECKKALTETDGDLEGAIELLRKKGTKDRGERVAGEGLVMAAVSGNRAALVELNSETDFVARNEDFKALARSLADLAATTGTGTVDGLLAQSIDGTGVGALIEDAVKRIGEKIVLGRVALLEAGEGSTLVSYVHNPGGSGSEGGKIGVLVETAGADANLGREVAMHVSFAKPRFLAESDVDTAFLDKEREIVLEQTKNDPKMVGKPEAAVNSAVQGRMRKVLGEIVLLNQPYVRDDKKTVGQLAKDAGGEIRRYVRFEVGENAPKSAE